ncbi:MAG: penicillin-binding protein 2 [Oscillospiraceae bacterium]|jgi:cell division protein FtsI/penicillin-binding protein 2|nr:penicillin-binding protein 2 [Oscillospiraceae bacterium]
MHNQKTNANADRHHAARAVMAFGLFCLLACLLMLRLFALGNQVAQTGGAQTAGVRVTAATRRAPIYDTNGVPLVDTSTKPVVVAYPSEGNLSLLRPLLSDAAYSKLRDAFADASPAVMTLAAPVPEQPDLLSTAAFQRYETLTQAKHVLGYVDADGVGITGMERAYDNFLTNHGGALSAVFPTNARGERLAGERAYWADDNYHGVTGLRLTLDKRIQRIAEDALDQGGIARGAAVVLDAKTGAIRAMVSRPDYDQNNVAASLEAAHSPLINRAILPYPVGSVFKPTIVAAALEAGLSPDVTFECKGSVTIGGVRIGCWNKAGHGRQTIAEGLANSCNPFFVQLAQKVSPELLLDMTRALGYGQGTLLAPGITAASGTLPDEDTLRTLPAALANFSFGQGDLLATPLQIAAAFSVIASSGFYAPPYLVEGFVDEKGALYNPTERGGPYAVLRGETADFLQDALLRTVREGTAKRAKSDLVAGCGKTGTAQVAHFDENGKELYAAWFAGFFPAWAPKYTIAIFKEDGAGGDFDCAPVFKVMSEKISALTDNPAHE